LQLGSKLNILNLFSMVVNNSQFNSKISGKKGPVTPLMAVLTLTILLLVGPTSMTLSVYAQGNTANQGIGQSQSSTQLGVCVSGTGTLISCNNLNAQNQANSGSNALAQSGGNGGGNLANQAIGQAQSSNQNALCVSGTGTFVSCNNINAQNQQNSGNNALSQQGGSGKGGNKATQGIGQSQSSNQNAQCVSGGNVADSCNNTSYQTQSKSGSNDVGQQGGSGKGGNSADQGIGQSQSSNQNAQCVSGKDAIVSCDNENFQNQVNSGSNVLGQQ
jgi:hypothetical protein